MQPDEHHRGRQGIEFKPPVFPGAQQGHELVMDPLDHLLAGADAVEDFFAHALPADSRHEIPGHLVVDVGLQQGHADFPHGIADIGFGEPPVAPEFPENRFQ